MKGLDDRFTLTNDLFRVERRRVRIPKLGRGPDARDTALCGTHRLRDGRACR